MIFRGSALHPLYRIMLCIMLTGLSQFQGRCEGGPGATRLLAGLRGGTPYGSLRVKPSEP